MATDKIAALYSQYFASYPKQQLRLTAHCAHSLVGR